MKQRVVLVALMLWHGFVSAFPLTPQQNILIHAIAYGSAADVAASYCHHDWVLLKKHSAPAVTGSNTPDYHAKLDILCLGSLQLFNSDRAGYLLEVAAERQARKLLKFDRFCSIATHLLNKFTVDDISYNFNDNKAQVKGRCLVAVIARLHKNHELVEKSFSVEGNLHAGLFEQSFGYAHCLFIKERTNMADLLVPDWYKELIELLLEKYPHHLTKRCCGRAIEGADALGLSNFAEKILKDVPALKE